MATPNLNILLQAAISVTDNLVSNAPQIILASFQNPTLGGTTANYDPYFQAFTAPTTVPFPGSVPTVWVVYVRNLDADNKLNVTVTTPATATPSTVTLGPAGVYLYFNTIETAGGINSLVLTGLIATVPCELLVAL